ncbi:winged helix-turn-helix domain-containing protein [Streptomyces koyangensis]|uniref:Winged helix family transcriptional regulator n=1 Tax=Streptomyces koyangensis TaxID=188770 RepID=A0A385DIB2_9ACTN|nr:winged helix-turn-helix domain-containing protein [Streptomyces koyangensis]AXQ57551.1 winged helix family transcriptional regulator [Streptomyces koyangensis]
MANTRTFTASTAPALTPAAGGRTEGRPPLARHRLRAVDRDETVPPAEVAALLPPGATWLPAPPHTLPSLPGRPPMIGYLVLVPAGEVPLAAPPVPEPAPATPAEVAAARDGEGHPVRVDPQRRTAFVDGRPLELTYLEFELLAHLVRHPHRVHTRDQLVTTVWGYGHVGDGRTVDVHIARLRRKLGAEYRRSIQTVRRVGYKYTPSTGRD